MFRNNRNLQFKKENKTKDPAETSQGMRKS